MLISWTGTIFKMTMNKLVCECDDVRKRNNFFLSLRFGDKHIKINLARSRAMSDEAKSGDIAEHNERPDSGLFCWNSNCTIGWAFPWKYLPHFAHSWIILSRNTVPLRSFFALRLVFLARRRRSPSPFIFVGWYVFWIIRGMFCIYRLPRTNIFRSVILLIFFVTNLGTERTLRVNLCHKM